LNEREENAILCFFALAVRFSNLSVGSASHYFIPVVEIILIMLTIGLTILPIVYLAKISVDKTNFNQAGGKIHTLNQCAPNFKVDENHASTYN
jgi:hypothetical protein